jgi:hypothetical protein
LSDKDPLRPWQRHTAQFVPRAIAMGATSFSPVYAHIDALPRAPLNVDLSDAAAIKYQVALLTISALRSAREIAMSSGKLWLQGHFLLASVGIRMLIELEGQLLWTERKVLSPLTPETTTAPFDAWLDAVRRPDHDNWTNAAFAAQVAPLLDRILGIAEVALENLEQVADRVFTAVVPAILAETGSHEPE